MLMSPARTALSMMLVASSSGRLRMQSTRVRTGEVIAPLTTSSAGRSDQCGIRILRKAGSTRRFRGTVTSGRPSGTLLGPAPVLRRAAMGQHAGDAVRRTNSPLGRRQRVASASIRTSVPSRRARPTSRVPRSLTSVFRSVTPPRSTTWLIRSMATPWSSVGSSRSGQSTGLWSELGPRAAVDADRSTGGGGSAGRTNMRMSPMRPRIGSSARTATFACLNGRMGWDQAPHGPTAAGSPGRRRTSGTCPSRRRCRRGA